MHLTVQSIQFLVSLYIVKFNLKNYIWQHLYIGNVPPKPQKTPKPNQTEPKWPNTHTHTHTHTERERERERAYIKAILDLTKDQVSLIFCLAAANQVA